MTESGQSLKYTWKNVIYVLGSEAARCEWLAEQADVRGDVAGADAWRLVVEAIRNAKDIAAKAVAQQTWDVDE